MSRWSASQRVFLSLSVVLASLFAWYLLREQTFPELSEPKEAAYNWTYANRPYTLTLTLHKSAYDFYDRSPKGILLGKEKASLEKYLRMAERDNSIKDLVARIKESAAKARLNEEQTLEFAVSFVQSIPYDTRRAADPDLVRQPRYAYQVLFDNQGICSEKSFLAYVVLRELGYGVAVFRYPKENHMNIGVESPLEYSTDNTGYSVIETTNEKTKIGVIPNLDPLSGQALQTQAVQEFNLRNPNTTTGKNLSSPLVYAKTTGKTYAGVIKTFQAQREFADTQAFLTAQRPVIEANQNDFLALDRRMKDLRAKNAFDAYNSLVYSHNRKVEELKELVDDFNTKVARYNALILEI